MDPQQFRAENDAAVDPPKATSELGHKARSRTTMPLKLSAEDDLQQAVRHWKLVEDGRVLRVWVTAAHRLGARVNPNAHPLLSWANTAHSQCELSLLMPPSELGGLARVASGRKPFAKEVVSDGPGAAREALSLARRLRAVAAASDAGISVRCEWVSSGGGEATGDGPHWAVYASMRTTWGEAFDLASIEHEWRALVEPLLQGDDEHARFETALADVRRLWRRLQLLPFSSHPFREPRPSSPLLRFLLWAHQPPGGRPVDRAWCLFGRKRRWMATDEFEHLVVSLGTFYKRSDVATPAAARALRRHLQWRAREIGRRVPPHHGRLLPRDPAAARRSEQQQGRRRSLPLHRSGLAALLSREAAALDRFSEEELPLWDSFDPQTGAELLLNGLLLGYALPSTAGALLSLLTRRTLRLRPGDGSSVAGRAQRVIGRPLDQALWASLQPGCPWPAALGAPGEWCVADVEEAGGSAGSSAEGKDGEEDAQGAELVLLRTRIFSMDDARREDLEIAAGSESDFETNTRK